MGWGIFCKWWWRFSAGGAALKLQWFCIACLSLSLLATNFFLGWPNLLCLKIGTFSLIANRRHSKGMLSSNKCSREVEKCGAAHKKRVWTFLYISCYLVINYDALFVQKTRSHAIFGL